MVSNKGEAETNDISGRVMLDGRDLSIRIAEIRKWLNRRGVDPGAFQYRLADEHVELRIELITLKEAADFAEAFGAIVLGIRKTAATRRVES